MEILRKNKSRTGIKNWTVEGYTFEVLRNVFPPAKDTELLARHIFPTHGEAVLDIGCGCGVNGILGVIRQAGRVVAVDINPYAVENTQYNANKYGIDICTRQSDIFGSVPIGQYDRLVANGPHHEGPIEHILDYACYGAQDFNTRLVHDAVNYMDRNSRLMIVYARLDGHDGYFQELLGQSHLKGEIIDCCPKPRGGGRYELYSIRREF